MKPIVAIDGPSGAGKTTVARGVAAALGLPYLETGAMYRALGLEVLERRIDPDDQERVEALARELDLRLERVSGGFEVLVDGRPVEARIRTVEVSEATSRVSVYPGVRERMVELQRQCALRHGAVLEGRDIGTQVFPETPHKFFLDAPAEVRIGRRLQQLREAGASEVTQEGIQRELVRRDQRDSTRAASPLTRDASYEVIDTASRSPEEVVVAIVRSVRARGSRQR